MKPADKQCNRVSRKTTVKTIEKLPERFQNKMYVYNLEEEKHNFLRRGIVPKLKRKFSSTNDTEIHFDYLPEATHILEEVKRLYGDGETYMEHVFGKRVDANYATSYLLDYIKMNGADGVIDIIWTSDLACSGKMTWHGPNVRYNRPEARKFCLWIKESRENTFLRQRGIKGFAHHEIGTHFLRTLNDGMQPWFSSRPTFGLRNSKSYQTQLTEEGLAAVNTLIDAQNAYLFIPALLYYTACKATEMNFRELFQHLSIYVRDEEQRWKHVMRVKRTLEDCAGLGGNGNDQCYFRGAVDILRNVNTLDFHLLYSGKICIDELSRVRRIARLGTVRLPHFMRDMQHYRKKLQRMAHTNGILIKTNLTVQIRTISRNRLNRKREQQLSASTIPQVSSFYRTS